jgi:hypothetical protein
VTQPGKVLPGGNIVLRDGTPEKVPTCYHGALRIRLLPANRAQIAVAPAQKGEVVFILEVTPEPRLQAFTVVGTPRLEKAVDDAGQQLTQAMEPMDGVNVVSARIVNPYYASVRQLPLRLKVDEKQAGAKVTLTGSLSVQAQWPLPEPLIVVEDVMKAAGKVAKGKTGGSIEIIAIEKMADGNYRVQYRYEQPAVGGNAFNGPAGGAVVVQAQALPAQKIGGPSTVRPGALGYPVLVDAKGKALELIRQEKIRASVINGKVTQEFTHVFRATNGVGEPVSMVLLGYRTVTAPVPFEFKDVRLP